MHMTLDSAFSPAALVGHAGYILLILSMLMTKMLWLRIIAIGAGILQALYYGVWLHDPVGTFWETIFTLTNVGQLAIIAYRNRTARFTADERAFYETAVPTLEAADARKLIAAGRWVTAEPGTVLTREGENAPVLAFIVSGEVDISINGKKVGDCGAGQLRRRDQRVVEHAGERHGHRQDAGPLPRLRPRLRRPDPRQARRDRHGARARLPAWASRQAAPDQHRDGDGNRDAGHAMNETGQDGSLRQPPDRLEIWAKRTGRILGFVVLFVLALYLLLTYAPR